MHRAIHRHKERVIQPSPTLQDRFRDLGKGNKGKLIERNEKEMKIAHLIRWACADLTWCNIYVPPRFDTNSHGKIRTSARYIFTVNIPDPASCISSRERYFCNGPPPSHHSERNMPIRGERPRKHGNIFEDWFQQNIQNLVLEILRRHEGG